MGFPKKFADNLTFLKTIAGEPKSKFAFPVEVYAPILEQ